MKPNTLQDKLGAMPANEECSDKLVGIVPTFTAILLLELWHALLHAQLSSQLLRQKL